MGTMLPPYNENIIIQVDDKIKLKFMPKDDITPLESVRISQLFMLANSYTLLYKYGRCKLRYLYS